MNKFHSVIILIFVLSGCSKPSTVQPTTLKKPNLFFIGLGVSTYSDSRLNNKYAVKDILDISSLLGSSQNGLYNNVYGLLYTNQMLTRKGIRSIKSNLSTIKAEDTLILYIAGHGVHYTNQERTYYYISYDTDLNNIPETALTLEEIFDLVRESPSKRRLCLIDGCNADTVSGRAPLPGAYSRGVAIISNLAHDISNTNIAPSVYYNSNRVVGMSILYSSSPGELSYEMDKYENGIFTEAVISALSGNADTDTDGLINITELTRYVSSSVIEMSKNQQHPMLYRDKEYQDVLFQVKTN